MGTHLRELSGSYLKNTNMIRFTWFSKFKNLCVLKLWTKLALALKGLNIAWIKDNCANNLVNKAHFNEVFEGELLEVF